MLHERMSGKGGGSKISSGIDKITRIYYKSGNMLDLSNLDYSDILNNLVYLIFTKSFISFILCQIRYVHMDKIRKSSRIIKQISGGNEIII